MLAVILWFLAMARIPVAGVTAIGFLNSIAVTPGAMLMGRADFGASCLVAKRLTERVPASVVVAMSLYRAGAHRRAGLGAALGAAMRRAGRHGTVRRRRALR